MKAAEIREKARAFVETGDPRCRRGMTGQDTQLFDIEVDRIRGRRWTRTGRNELRQAFWRDQGQVPR